MSGNKTILFIGWKADGRDFEADFPLMYFFENYLSWEVTYVSIWNTPKILSSCPDLIFMSNTIGSFENFNLSRIIHKSGFMLFSHISEGLFRENEIEEFVFGWNKEKFFSEEFCGIWSDKSFELVRKYYPQLSSFYRVTGAMGYDKYQIFSRKRNCFFDKVIGYACFDFNNIVLNKDKIIESLGMQTYLSIVDRIKEINLILTELIIKNNDKLFVIKRHPGDGERLPLEFKGLERFENVRLLDSEVSIFDAISMSDIWLSHNSSTNLEAWLLNKPSISFNTDKNNYSSDVINGSIVEDNSQKIQGYIDEFYQTNKIIEFDKKINIRQKLIKDYIGYADGLNHVRFASFMKIYISNAASNMNIKKKWQVPLALKIKSYIKYHAIKLSKLRYSPKYVKNWGKFYDVFDDAEYKKRKEELSPFFDQFYFNNVKKIDRIYNCWPKLGEKFMKN